MTKAELTDRLTHTRMLLLSAYEPLTEEEWFALYNTPDSLLPDPATFHDSGSMEPSGTESGTMRNFDIS